MESNMDKRICPNCGEPCEKEYETVFVHGQELCVCCNSNIEPCCEEDGFTDNILNDGGENNNVFVDFFYETGQLYRLPCPNRFSMETGMLNFDW